jgi:hypothetical protein
MATEEEKETPEEGHDAGDQCGRCGCARRNHTPACVHCPKCHSFSTPKPQGRKTSRNRRLRFPMPTLFPSNRGLRLVLTARLRASVSMTLLELTPLSLKVTQIPTSQ